MKLGSKAWSACLETSPHQATSSDQGASPRYHTHGYLLWSDGIGYRNQSLDIFKFDGVCARIDKCNAGSNTRLPRRSALHGLWYVLFKKAGTISEASNWKPWKDFVPSGCW